MSQSEPFDASNTDGVGVYGRTLGASGIGVEGWGGDKGVLGTSGEGRGVEGQTSSSNEWVSAIYANNAGSRFSREDWWSV